LRHSMDRTTGDFGSRVGESELGCARSMVIGNTVGSALGGRGVCYIYTYIYIYIYVEHGMKNWKGIGLA
jgi:hypothetical protein